MKILGGNITAKGGNATSEGSSYGVEVENLIISGGSLTATGGAVKSAYANSIGVWADVTVNGGVLTASGKSMAISGSLTADGAKSILTNTTASEGTGLFDASKISTYKWMSI